MDMNQKNDNSKGIDCLTYFKAIVSLTAHFTVLGVQSLVFYGIESSILGIFETLIS